MLGWNKHVGSRMVQEGKQQPRSVSAGFFLCRFAPYMSGRCQRALSTGGAFQSSKKTLGGGFRWMFPKIGGFPPKSSILIGFSIINHPF